MEWDGAAGEGEVAATGDEVGADAGAEQGAAEGEVELPDSLEVGEAGLSDAALEAGLVARGDFVAGEGEQEPLEGPILALGLLDEGGPGAPGIGKMQPLEEGGEFAGSGRSRVLGGGGRGRSSAQAANRGAQPRTSRAIAETETKGQRAARLKAARATRFSAV